MQYVEILNLLYSDTYSLNKNNKLIKKCCMDNVAVVSVIPAPLKAETHNRENEQNEKEVEIMM